MASEYWLCVQIPVTARSVQTEKDKRRRYLAIFRGPSNFLPFHGTNRHSGFFHAFERWV
jgi:hypothetical protein